MEVASQVAAEERQEAGAEMKLKLRAQPLVVSKLSTGTGGFVADKFQIRSSESRGVAYVSPTRLGVSTEQLADLIEPGTLAGLPVLKAFWLCLRFNQVGFWGVSKQRGLVDAFWLPENSVRGYLPVLNEEFSLNKRQLHR